MQTPKQHNSDKKPLLNHGTLKLVEEALAIEAEEAKAAGALGFMARMLVQATMPHRDPGEVAAWGRRNGSFSLVIQPGMIIEPKTHLPQSVGLPYGSLPRLLLAWISTEAVRNREPLVVLGDTLSAFMRELDLVPTGGRWGSITRLRMQMKRLFPLPSPAPMTGMSNGPTPALESPMKPISGGTPKTRTRLISGSQPSPLARSFTRSWLSIRCRSTCGH